MEQLPDYTELSQLTDQQLTEIFGVRDFFTYELDFASLPSVTGNTAQASFTVQADSNFLWQQAAFFADIAAAAQTDSSRVIPLVSCVITDSSSGRQLSSSAVPLTSLFGNGQLPYILPTPRFFRAQTQVNVSLLNFAVVNTTYNLKLSFIGTKFFKFAQSI